MAGTPRCGGTTSAFGEDWTMPKLWPLSAAGWHVPRFGPQALLDGMSPGLVEPRRVSPIPVCLRVALKKGSLRRVQASPLQLLQMPSKGWEEGKLLHKELDLS